MPRLTWILTGIFLAALGFGTFQLSGSTHAANHDAPLGTVACTAPECIIYSIESQSDCTQLNSKPTYQAAWTTGLSLNVDQQLRKGEIVAYKLQWFNGTWSDWYVPGVNDIDIKYNNGPTNEMRRFWSYFYDHNHTYIICTN
ncbi:MAG TPA: hypothetical protein VFS21_34200 [Roseiflexaceae bacterium]|nr:hypothetical protein [Roseiflexaceae bacterium]